MAATLGRPAGPRLETKTERRPLPPGAEQVIDHAPRCWRCRLPLFERAARPWAKKCDHCGAQNGSPSGAASG